MMSIQRYQLKNRKLDKMSFHLLYISTSRYEGDWHSTPPVSYTHLDVYKRQLNSFVLDV